MKLDKKQQDWVAARTRPHLSHAHVQMAAELGMDSRSLGKLEAPDGFAGLLLDAGAEPLPITVEHAEATGALPWHHRDPFDRVLVAQAGIEGATLVTGDERLAAYGVPVAW